MDNTVGARNRSWWDLSVVGYALAGILAGLYAVMLPFPASILAIAGLALVYYSVAKPEIGILTIVVLIASILFEESLPLIPIGVGSLHISDLLLIALLCKIPYQSLTGRTFRIIRTPLDVPLLLFFGTALVSAVLALTRFGVDFATVTRNLRSVTYYLAFFVITNHIRSKKQALFLIKGLLSIAVFVAIAMVVQAVVGDAVQLMPGRVEQAGTFDSQYEALRILPPGQTMIYSFFIVTGCLLVMARQKPLLSNRHFYAALLLGAGVLLTYNRVYWVAIILSALILMKLVTRQERKRLIPLLVGAVVFLVGTSVLFVSLGGRYGQTAASISERFTSLFAGSELTQSGPIEDRRLENEYALKAIAQHPLLGIGLGNSYRPQIYGDEDLITHYVHNGYLWFMKDMGVIGLSFFLWFFFGFLIRGLRNVRRIQDPFFKSAATGFILGGIGMIPMTFFNPVLMQWFSIITIAITAGLTEVIVADDEAGPMRAAAQSTFK